MICWFHRMGRARHADVARELPESIRRHLETCASCREAWEQERRVHAALAHASRNAIPAAPPFLHGRIMAAVRRESRPGLKPRAAGAGPRFAFATVGLAAVLVAVLVTLAPWRQPGGMPVLPGGQTLPWPVSLPEPAELARMGTWLDQPLLDEGRLVMQDARNAVQGIASNLLPAGVSLAQWFPGR